MNLWQRTPSRERTVDLTLGRTAGERERTLELQTLLERGLDRRLRQLAVGTPPLLRR